MLTKEYQKGQLFFGNEEIGFQPLGELTEVELNENCDISDDIQFLDASGSCEFTADIQLPERMTVGDIILGICGFDVEKLKQNNWRKMHGIPMRRRCGKCKSLKNGKPEKQRRNSGKKISG